VFPYKFNSRFFNLFNEDHVTFTLHSAPRHKEANGRLASRSQDALIKTENWKEGRIQRPEANLPIKERTWL
jgi:hypothetical protein